MEEFRADSLMNGKFSQWPRGEHPLTDAVSALVPKQLPIIICRWPQCHTSRQSIPHSDNKSVWQVAFLDMLAWAIDVCSAPMSFHMIVDRVERRCVLHTPCLLLLP